MMVKCCTADLRCKEVINVCDGKRLGFATEVEFNICDGKITSIVVPGECNIFGFSRGDEIVIPWDKIEKIGEDIILVRVAEHEISCRCDGEERKKKKKLF